MRRRRIEEIVESKLSDVEFLDEISELDREELDELLGQVVAIRDEARAELFSAIAEFRETGIPAAPAWFGKCKNLTNIRNKHIMMIERAIRKK